MCSVLNIDSRTIDDRDRVRSVVSSPQIETDIIAAQCCRDTPPLDREASIAYAFHRLLAEQSARTTGWGGGNTTGQMGAHVQGTGA